VTRNTSVSSSGTDSEIDERLTFTRRTALSLIGLGGVFGVASAKPRSPNGNSSNGDHPSRRWNQDVNANGHDLFDLHSLTVQHVYTSARDTDVVVWRDEKGVFHADGHTGEVASGTALMAVVQGAVDSLTDGRTSKEKVLIASPGTVHSEDEHQSVDLPSYTTIDSPVTITAKEGVETLFTARDEQEIEITNLTVKGPAAGAISFSSVDHATFGNLWVEDVTGIGVRIDGDGETGNSTDVMLQSAYFENTGSQGFETYNVDRITIGQVLGKDTGASVVLLNETTDVSATSIVGKNPGFDYATFRLANTCANVSVGEVVSRGGVRGLSIITGTHDVTVGEVNIIGGRKAGILLVDVENVMISGGVVKNNDGPGVNIWSLGLEGTASQINEGITISNVRFVDDRPEGKRKQTWAVYEDGASLYNRYINNDIRDGGTEGSIKTATARSVVRDNFGGGVDSGSVTLAPGTSPAARVEGVSNHQESTLSVDAKPFNAPNATFAWESYFEWDGKGAWDLVFEWRTDPGQPLELDYVIDRPQVAAGRELDRQAYWNETVQGPITSGVYRIENVRSGKVLETDGTNIQQGKWENTASQKWDVEYLPTGTPADEYKIGEFRITNRASGRVMGIAGGSQQPGANIRQGVWTGGENQKWYFERYENGYQLEAAHSGLIAGIDGANVLQTEWLGKGSQIWTFKEL
jgi:hypothetical protein